MTNHMTNPASSASWNSTIIPDGLSYILQAQQSVSAPERANMQAPLRCSTPLRSAQQQAELDAAAAAGAAGKLPAIDFTAYEPLLLPLQALPRCGDAAAAAWPLQMYALPQAQHGAVPGAQPAPLLQLEAPRPAVSTPMTALTPASATSAVREDATSERLMDDIDFDDDGWLDEAWQDMDPELITAIL